MFFSLKYIRIHLITYTFKICFQTVIRIFDINRNKENNNRIQVISSCIKKSLKYVRNYLRKKLKDAVQKPLIMQ